MDLELDLDRNRVIGVDNGTARVVGVDLTTGVATDITPFSMGPTPDDALVEPQAITRDAATGRAWVVDSTFGGVFAVDLATGDRVTLSR